MASEWPVILATDELRAALFLVEGIGLIGLRVEDERGKVRRTRKCEEMI